MSGLIITAACALIGYGLHQLNHQTSEGVVAHKALCAFKLDLQQRIAADATFLLLHPHGILGIDPDSVRLTNANQINTLKSLSILHC